MPGKVTRVRVIAKEGTYRLTPGESGGVRCVEELPDGDVREINFHNQIPDRLLPYLLDARELVWPTPKYLPSDPWSSPYFRFGGLGNCTDCSGTYAGDKKSVLASAA